MATEIERKFLVNRSVWRPDPALGTRYRQGYLASELGCTVRVRIAGDRGFLTVKGRTRGIERLEFEYPIPSADAGAMLAQLCDGPLIEKTRYRVPFAGRMWEVDVFDGDNTGLILAEVELPSADAEVALPPWAGREVSGDPRYYNANLVRNPYAQWGAAEPD